MNQLFSRIALIDVHRDMIRNIVSLIESQDLFDDLTDNPEEWSLAQQVEEAIRPPFYQSRMPVIHRPFEDAKWSNAIVWPFNNWQLSRFSDGSFGVWYGSDSVKTTVFESVCHWYSGLLCDAGFEKEETVISERKLYSVKCDAGLLDFRLVIEAYPDLVHKTDYTFTQSVGARIHHEGYPGLLTVSTRYQNGENYTVFNSEVLSNPRHYCYLIYQLEEQYIVVIKSLEVYGRKYQAMKFESQNQQLASTLKFIKNLLSHSATSLMQEVKHDWRHSRRHNRFRL